MFVLLILPVTLGWQNCLTCKWSKRTDRYEGVLTEEMHSSTGFELIAVQHQIAASSAAPSGEVYLFFWLPSAETPEIEVWNPTLKYLMRPDAKRYEGGRAVYSWSGKEVLEPLGLRLERLYSKVRNPGGRIYYPALLATTAQPPAATTYVFAFKSNAGFDVDCAIEREDPEGGRTSVVTFSKTEEDAGIYDFEWNGLDQQGRKMPKGIYSLSVRGTLDTDRGDRLEPRIFFYHRG